MAAPTREDAQLMIQLAQWGTSLGFEDAMPELFAEGFDPETADLRSDAVRKVLMIGESIGTLTKHDLLSTERVHDWLWIAGLWARVRPAAHRARAELGEPACTRTSSGSPRALSPGCVARRAHNAP